MIDNKDELKDRVKAKKAELESRYHELKADGRAEAREESGKLKRKLDELQETVRDGWDDLSDKVSAKLNEWLK
jgi:hypothetical protein